MEPTSVGFLFSVEEKESFSAQYERAGNWMGLMEKHGGVFFWRPNW